MHWHDLLATQPSLTRLIGVDDLAADLHPWRPLSKRTLFSQRCNRNIELFGGLGFVGIAGDALIILRPRDQFLAALTSPERADARA